MADSILLLPIYYAREEDDGTISSQILSDRINTFQNNHNSQAFNSFEAVEEVLQGMILTDKDVIVTMGAGEAFKVGDQILYPQG